MKSSSLTPEEISLAVSLHKRGIGIRDIGFQLKRSWKVVSEALHDAGIELRPGGRAGAPAKWGDPVATLPIGKVPPEHSLAALDAMIIAERRWALAQHQARKRREAEAGVQRQEEERF